MTRSHLCVLVISAFLGAASGKASAQDRSLDQREPEQDMVSQHMSSLYEKYNREKRLREGNTVRSVRANQASSDHWPAYQLNLTTLQDSEVILAATFHFPLERRPRQKPWFCKRFKTPSCRSAPVQPPVRLLFRSGSPGSKVRPESPGSLLGNLTFHPHRRGVWQMKDVSQVIKEAVDKGHRLVSVELDVGQQRKVEELLPAAGLPYLLVYADDQALAEPNSVAASLQRYDPFGEGADASPSAELPHKPVPRERTRREATVAFGLIQNNELPEVDYQPEGFRKDDLWQSTWYHQPKSKLGRKEEKRKSHGVDVEKESRAERHGATVPVGGDRTKHVKDGHSRTTGEGRKLERRGDGKDVKKHKGRSDARSPVLSFDEETMRDARRKQWSSGRHRGTCSRRNLRVDFADIGWSEWIIAPKAFEAYYCSGTCGFPMPKVTRPTNHATIQSIVRAVGIVPGVPEPCCVPERMSPLAVLFRDESGNPVLKVYPDMSIQSCSCR